MVPKWTPEASGNVCGRGSATERAKNASWRPPGREKIGKKVFLSSTNRLSNYSVGLARLLSAPGAPRDGLARAV